MPKHNQNFSDASHTFVSHPLPFEIVVISLSNAQQRQKTARQQLANSPFLWRFLAAVEGAAFTQTPPEYDTKQRERHFGYPMQNNEIACFLSHREAWRYALTLSHPLCILEDDFIFAPHALQVIHDLVQQQESWDLLRLQGLLPSRSIVTQQADNYALVHLSRDPKGSAAFMLNPKAAQILLASSQQFAYPVDVFLAQEWRFPQLKYFSVQPYPIQVPNEETSTIGERHRPPLNVWDKAKREYYRLPIAYKKHIGNLNVKLQIFCAKGKSLHKIQQVKEKSLPHTK